MHELLKTLDQANILLKLVQITHPHTRAAKFFNLLVDRFIITGNSFDMQIVDRELFCC